MLGHPLFVLDTVGPSDAPTVTGIVAHHARLVVLGPECSDSLKDGDANRLAIADLFSESECAIFRQGVEFVLRQCARIA